MLKGSTEEGGEIAHTDKLNAISGLELKTHVTVIKDSDPDLSRHVRMFQNLIACHAFGRKEVRPIDVLHLFGKTFPEGSTRAKVYSNQLRKVQNDGRLPLKAKEVLDEIIEELKKYIRETTLQKQTRLDLEFQCLCMGTLRHSTFRAMWVEKLQDMEESMMDMPT